MRAQYHFRDSVEGLCAWDVRKLVQLADTLPVIDVRVSDIAELDEPYWYDHATPTTRSVADHAKQVAAADLSYPIILCAQGRLMDGMHRTAKAYMAGFETIKAVRLLATPPPDYIGIAPENLPYDD